MYQSHKLYTQLTTPDSQMTSSTPSYYSNINAELLDICQSANRVIEFGCGAGRFLEAYKSINPQSECIGFELFESAAKEAQERCDKVITGNAEQDFKDLNLYGPEAFDLIIYGDVLEHFLNPWQTLQQHLTYLKPGGTVCACIPNASHWSIIFELVNGTFNYKDSGLLDRTHLRFFTKATIIELFQTAGLELEYLAPRSFQTKNTANGLATLAKLFDKPLDQISKNRIEDWSTFQYLVRATKPK
ncbi:MAG: class I SAM-dependent methyltransferase [Kordiimonas sp.]